MLIINFDQRGQFSGLLSCSQAEVNLLKNVVAQRSDSDLAEVLEEVKKQLHDLASEFSAFKKVESQQLMHLKEAVGNSTQVFNVAYPPFIIPLVSVHESKDRNDKSINISGEAC